MNKNFVHASFSDEAAAQMAVRELLDESFRPRMISVTTRENGRVRRVPIRHSTGVLPGASVGAIFGAVCGVMLTTAFGLVDVGPLLAFFEGLIGGAAAGALAGGLLGLTFWSDDADFSRASVDEGEILVGVSTGDARVDNAREALQRAQPVEPPEVVPAQSRA